MAAGVRYVSLSPQIRAVLVRAALFGLGASALPALMPLVARDLIGGGPLTYGILLGGFGGGAVAGALLIRRLRERLSTEAIVRLAAVGLAIGATATALTGWVALTIPALALAGAGWVLALSTFNVSVQMASPRWVVARAISLYQMAAFGGLAAGSWLFGAVAGDQGVATALLVAAAVQLLSVAAGLILPLMAIKDVDLDPGLNWREPDTAVPVQARSGPIVITVEHRIETADIAAFLTAMSERRRIRRRDGARQWALLRDLAEPTLWIERYRFPTWIDYVRHNERRTKADQANSEALAGLWIGGVRPIIHRRIERQTGSLPSVPMSDDRGFDPVTDPSRSA
jgi:MFS family permease